MRVMSKLERAFLGPKDQICASCLCFGNALIIEPDRQDAVLH